jgi:hypothetical protein
VIELRFHEELYDGFAIDEAVKLYEPYAHFSLMREPGGFIVRVDPRSEADGGADPALVAAELMNYALGKTIERSRAVSEAAAPSTPADTSAAQGAAE